MSDSINAEMDVEEGLGAAPSNPGMGAGAAQSNPAKPAGAGANPSAPLSARALEFLRDVPLEVTVELGRTRMPIGELFALGPSSIIELDKGSDEPLDVRINGVLIARGEAVNVNDRFGIRLTSIVESDRLMDTLKGD